MGRSLFALGELADAESVWRESIQIAWEVRGISLILESILGIASIRAKDGNSEQAYALLLVVLNHPISVDETKVRASTFRAELEAQLTLPQIDSVRARSERKTLELVIDDIDK